jgi:predicted esterase
MQPGLRRLGVTALLCWTTRSARTAALYVSSSETGRCRYSSSTVRPMSTSSSVEDSRVVRVLALHGSEGTAEEFPSRLEALQSMLASDHNVQLEITSVEGPFPKGGGYSWWTMKPGERSFTAIEYGGFDTAAERVLQAWNTDPPYDLCLGHSQGAIMIAALVTLGKVPYHPSLGYVFNGVSFPNPYRKQMEDLKIEESSSSSSMGAPRVLFIMGTNDKVTPNETGEELRDSFRNAGLAVDTVKHSGGHGIPNEQDETIKAITQWISDKM